jgi:hypothetical protein
VETCKYGLGAGMRKPTAERRQGVLYRAYEIAGIKELLTQRIRNPEEIPKYLDINQALLYLGKLGFLISRSKLYKLT